MSDEASDDAPDILAKDAATRRADTPGREPSVSGVAVTINKPRAEVYAFWRDFSNLVGVMENVESIDVIDRSRSHWTVKGPTTTYEWDAIVTEDVEGERIAWKSGEDADVRNSGWVSFADAAPGRGTVVTAAIAYDPPGGFVGKVVAKLTQKEPAIQARRDLRRLKQFLETGEIATSTPPNPAPKA
ncbi:SRPBCC family protein [Sphingomonas sp. ac-8]|uniref:SRPBCC family protein n=1 Tax=Sphingomonas sp. ac-8 TaxID=3242977 RepID=UPI003A804E63